MIKEVKNKWLSKGEIIFKNFSLRYRPQLPLALKNLNIRIKAGEKIGVVGRTGAGKSTIILGLLRIVEADSGSIEIDGVNISDLGLKDVRSGITIIP